MSASAWGQLKPDPALDAARREAEERERLNREREERERQQRRDREERERKEREREEKLRKEQQEREQRERERERKEKERRDMERREMERERLLQQQRLDNAKAARDRSPLRNGDSDIRIKEEPRKDDPELLMRTDPRYQMAAWQMGRHPAHMLPPPHLSRPGMLPPTSSLVGLPPHYAPAPGWPPSHLDPYRDPYRLMDPMLRTYQIPNPMLDAMRAEEAKAYATASALYRGKDPSPIPQPGHPPSVPSPLHHRLPPNGPATLKPPSVVPSSPISANDLHKKEDAPR